MTNSKALIKYIESATRQFLQTAVYVDDNLFFETVTNGSSVTEVSDIPPRKNNKVSHNDSNGNSSKSHTDIEYISESDENLIINNFAKNKIICSLYKPDRIKLTTNKNELVEYCNIADIIILDWQLYEKGKSTGKHTTDIIGSIVIQAMNDVPEQLRLIIIYTVHRDNKIIMDKIINYLKNNGISDGNIKIDVDYKHLEIHNCRVSIFYKRSRFDTVTPENDIVDFSDIADEAIEEFTKLVPGILQAATLLGLSTIRKNYKKIITKFNINVDRGFLTHLGMSDPNENPKAHIIPLLVSEIESLLEDELSESIISKSVISDWVNTRWEPGDHVKSIINERSGKFKIVAKKILNYGIKEAKRIYNFNKKFVHKLFLKEENNMDNLNFSYLLTNRTFYENVPKTLTQGSILYNYELKSYIVCIQPVCDCVRLDKLNYPRKFLFVDLQIAASEADKASHVVKSLNDNLIELFCESKSFNCTSIMFDSNNKYMVTARKKYNENKYYFQCVQHKKYYWIGQLKPIYIQKIVEEFGSNVSRVGVTELEWLRIRAKND